MGLDPEFAQTPPFAGPFSGLNRMLRRDSLQFHFACYALCDISFYEDEGDVTVDSAKLIGFWLTREEADLAARGRESRLRAEHEAQYKVTDGRWPAWPWNNPGYAANHYEIVPLASVRFNDLMDLDQAIEEAAKARTNGIGVEVARLNAQLGGAA